MISVGLARRKVLQEGRVLATEKLSLGAALGRVLAEAPTASYGFPLADVSAMDGYALKVLPGQPGSLLLQGQQAAGDPPRSLKSGWALKIMTGALVPKGADAVVPKEWVREDGGRIHIEGCKVRPGDHIRRKDEEIEAGARLLEAGHVLRARSLGFLAGLGVNQVEVFKKPRVSLLVTGSELAPSGARPRPGQIFDSNTPLLLGALEEAGIRPWRVSHLKDNPASLRRALRQVLAASDMVLLTGGVSVGDSDFSRPVLRDLAVRTVFWGVAQKPGYPLYFGKFIRPRSPCLVFGLPGNPASVYVCFQQYVLAALNALQGRAQKGEAGGKALAMLSHAFQAQKKKTAFLKARIRPRGSGLEVEVLPGQQSHMLGSLALANGLAEIPAGKDLKRGDTVRIHYFGENG